MADFPARAVFDLGKVRVELFHLLKSQFRDHEGKQIPEIRRALQRSALAGVDVPEIDARHEHLVRLTEPRDLLRRADLALLAHGLGAEQHVAEPVFVDLFR